jgi:G:T-mismatch repair DNA endonuclease (very short patch repair protein)
MYGVSDRRVQKWLRYYDIPRTHLNRPRIRPNEAQLHKWYWDENWTLPQIASHCGVSYPAVRAWFLKYNILRRSNSQAQCLCQGTQNLTKELLKELYWEKELSQGQIAKELGITQSAIKEKMKRFDIPRRGKGNSGSRNGMFGRTHTQKAIEKMRAANHRQFSDPKAREQAAINSARAIAEGRIKKTRTKPEVLFSEILDSLSITYDWQYRIGRYVYDFHIQQENLLIEVNGTFWHADPRFYDHSNLGKTQRRNVDRDMKKAMAALEKGFRLAYFWEYDICTDDNLVRKDLLAILKA